MLSLALNLEGLTYRFEKVACNLDPLSGADTVQEGQTLELEGFLRETAQESNSLWGSLPEGRGGPVGLEQQTAILEGEGLWPQVFRDYRRTHSAIQAQNWRDLSRIWDKKKKKQTTRLEMWERLQGGFTGKKKKKGRLPAKLTLSPQLSSVLLAKTLPHL